MMIQHKNSVSAMLLAALLLGASAVHAQTTDPVNVILDTDMASDVDDAGALATLLALEDLGEANVLAVGVSVLNEWSPLCADAITTFYGRPDIPLGTAKSGRDDGSAYAQQIAEEFPRSRGWESADDAPDAIDVYREVLSQQPDNSVTFITIGPLTNAAGLLQSDPCEHSDLDGRDLVEQKVERWVCMGGSFGFERDCGRRGREHNTSYDYEATKYALTGSNKWPTPVLFSPFYVGRWIKTGPGLEDLPEDNITRRAYELYYSDDIQPHPSYDQCALHYAVRGLDGGPAEDYYEIKGPGWFTIFDEGYGHEDEWFEEGWNGFEYDPDGLHTYKKEGRENYDEDLISAEIEELMKHNPEGVQ